MKNAFLPKSVHYASSKEIKEAYVIAESSEYESMFFDPKDIDNDGVYVIIDAETDFRVLRTQYDSCIDRFFQGENDTLHIFKSRSEAFRYLSKKSRV